jgi:DNA polymerase II small subunit
MKEKVLKVLLDHGTLIEPEASDYILSQKDPVRFIKDFLEGRQNLPLILSLEDIRIAESILDFDETESAEQESNPPKLPETGESPDRPIAQKQLEMKIKKSSVKPLDPNDRQDDIHIIMDITGTSTCDGSIENFTNYFRDRFRVLRRIIKSHVEMSGPIQIKKVRYMDREAKIIGMVMDVQKTKNGHLGITVEDDTGEIFVLIHKESELIDEVILKDEVLGFVGKVSSGSRGPGQDKKNAMFIPSAIHRPRIPVNRRQRRASSDIEVAFMSDIHMGSAHFLQEAWDRFVQWTNSPEASNLRYIVVAGDMVDGIGVYPNQEKELLIKDIYKQYEELARIMEPIPKHIKIIMQPGNHDAVRPAEPQPAISAEFQRPFGDNFIFVGNPCYFSIAGVEILSYHGKSIDDLVEMVPGVEYEDPIPPMLEMMKRRHLAITYGAKTPLAPEVKDYMAINPVPDIFVTGHVHRTSVHKMTSMTMINASAWQSQTPFQKMHNFHPDPAKVVLANLRTGRCKILDFME